MIDVNFGKYKGIGYEIQWYDKEGNAHHFTRCDTIEELALTLSRYCWGDPKPYNNPTIYHNGERFGEI